MGRSKGPLSFGEWRERRRKSSLEERRIQVSHRVQRLPCGCRRRKRHEELYVMQVGMHWFCGTGCEGWRIIHSPPAESLS